MTIGDKLARVASREGQARACIAIDAEADCQYVSVSQHVISRVSATVNDPEVLTIDLEPMVAKGSSVVSMQFLAESQSLCVACSMGEILVIGSEPFRQPDVDAIVGDVESGIEAMQWSPDGEVVVFATGKRTVLAMTKDFDMISEFSCEVDDQGKDEFINVGWGRKETQFHGSAGKAAREGPGPGIDSRLALNDDFMTRISWRGDGALFAIVEMSWSIDSAVLAIWVTSDNGGSKIQLWTTGNYHWYLKQEIMAPADDAVNAFAWDPEVAVKIHVSLKSGVLRTLEFIFDVQTTTSLAPTTPATVAVTDGDMLLLTPFRMSNAPPPMYCKATPSQGLPIISCAFGSDPKDDDIAVMLSDYTVVLCKSRGADPISEVAKFSNVNNGSVFVQTSSGEIVEDVDELLTKGSMAERRIERGARLITVVPNDTKMVLQMPRGNLETVRPRPLVTSVIKTLLDNTDFKEAFYLCRTHRIDMNILVDYSPDLFFNNTSKFVDGIADPDHLNLFISSLRTPRKRSLSKINAVCSSIASYLLSKEDRTKYITTLLTTDVKKSPPDLEVAMRRVKTLKEVSVEEAEGALQYLIFIADVDRLYDVSLGMYDFGLAVMVAQYSNKDPREYIPFLTELRELPVFRQRFRIDDHLKRWESALMNLKKIEDHQENPTSIFSEIQEYCKRHALFTTAFKLYEADGTKRNVLMRLYGDYLDANSRLPEAGHVAGEFEKAIDCFSRALMWREALSAGHTMQMSESDVAHLSRSLSTALAEDNRYDDATRLLVDYCQDVVEGVNCLLKGALWSEAHRLCHKEKREGLISEVVKPALLEASQHVRDDLETLVTSFLKQRERLNTVREQNAKNLAAALNGDFDVTLDSVDMMSDSSSLATSKNTPSSFRSHTTKSVGTFVSDFTAAIATIKEGMTGVFEGIAENAAMLGVVERPHDATRDSQKSWPSKNPDQEPPTPSKWIPKFPEPATFSNAPYGVELFGDWA
ncbi:hypothetical protein HK101_004229 [Irineochytrium annulatum]|nr:hypothetical protein HK101_004229 [Irineochytrium annulatum]